MIKKNIKTGVYSYKGKDITFNFYSNLTAYDKIKFINFVVNTLIVGDDYYAVIKELIFDFEIIDIFTDIDISEIKEAPDTINRIEDFLSETNIVEIVKANVDKELIEELSRAVDDNIEYRTGIHKNNFTDILSHFLKVVEKKIENINTEEMMEMATKINNIAGELTPEKILDAYSRTDMFKQKISDANKQRKTHNQKINKIVKQK